MNKSSCKHYNGDYHNKTCRAGVCYADVTTGTKDEPGSAFRKPCVDWTAWSKEIGSPLSPAQLKEWERHGTCDKFEFPTAEEIVVEEAEMLKHMQKVMLVTNFIAPMRKLNTGTGYQTVAQCPNCKGKLHVSISGYNGHAKVICETEGCVRFIE